jgi:hypothetical protein
MGKRSTKRRNEKLVDYRRYRRQNSGGKRKREKEGSGICTLK